MKKIWIKAITIISILGLSAEVEVDAGPSSQPKRVSKSASNSTVGGGSTDPLRSPPPPATVCPDTNSDGQVTPADLALFVSRFNAGDMTSDFDRNGRLEPVDVSQFTNNYYSYLQNPVPGLCSSQNCVTSNSSFQTLALPTLPASGGYSISFNLTANDLNYHGVLLSDSVTVSGYQDSRASLWTSPQGLYEYREGTSGQAIASSVRYTVGQADRVRIHIVDQSVSFYITHSGTTNELPVLENGSLNQNVRLQSLGLRSPDGGSAQICNLSVSADAPERIPNAPTNLTAAQVNGTSMIQLSANDNSNNESRFELERRNSNGVVLQTIILSANSNPQITATDTPSVAGSYSYALKACNSAGCSTAAVSSAVSFNPPPPAPSTGWTNLIPTLTGTYKSKLTYVNPTNCSANAPDYFADDPSIGTDPRQPIGNVSAVCSLEAAYSRLRNGYPDWILVKKGTSQTLTRYISLNKMGRSATERQVITSYGIGPRPIIIAGPDYQNLFGGVIFWTGYYYSGMTVGNLAVVGLEFKPRAGEEYISSALSFYGGEGSAGSTIHISNMIFEDNKFSKFQRGIALDWIENVRVFRNVFEDMAGRNRAGFCAGSPDYTAGYSGFAYYVGTSNNFTSEENIMLQRFFTYGIRPVCFQDNAAYIENAATGLTLVKRNIVINKGDYANTGMFSRSSGTEFVDNFVYGFGTGIDVAGQDAGGIYPNGIHAKVTGNIILKGAYFGPNEPSGAGISIHATDDIGVLVENNIVANQRLISTSAGIELSRGPFSVPPQNNTIQNNVIYNWNGLTSFISRETPSIGLNNRFLNNEVQQQSTTIGDQNALVQIVPGFTSANILFSGNKYFSTRGTNYWFDIPAGFFGFSYWQQNYEANAVSQRITYANPDVDHLLTAFPGLTTIDAVMNALGAQSRDTWNSAISIDELLRYTRASFNR